MRSTTGSWDGLACYEADFAETVAASRAGGHPRAVQPEPIISRPEARVIPFPGLCGLGARE